MTTMRCVAVLTACAGFTPSLLAGTVPQPPGGHWANEHLGAWRPDQPDFGLEFATVTHPGNRPANASERRFPQSTTVLKPDLGRVDYAYRISTTEVSASQWLPFFFAILPHYQAVGGSGLDDVLQSEHIELGGPLGFELERGAERSAVRVGWEFAARYCNWLHNGAPTGADATLEVFQTGAYDMPALSPNADQAQMPLTRNADARYWLPTLDEWVKAAHYDPDRYGEGQEGYWLRMGGQDEELVGGLPWQGGKTTSGDPFPFPEGTDPDTIPVAAYGVTSPWGLFDTSGQESEWTETAGAFFGYEDQNPEFRYVVGSGNTTPSFFFDTIDGHIFASPLGDLIGATTSGFRIASAIPSPAAGGVFLLGTMHAARRRR